MRALESRFSTASIGIFYRMLGLSILLLVVYEVFNAQWSVHAGVLCPRRLPTLIPLYPPAALALEWALTLAAGLWLLSGKGRRKAAALAAAILAVSLTQRFLNQKLLIFFFALYGAVDEESPGPSLILWQTTIVYWASALAKLRWGFASGDSLAQVLRLASDMPGAVSGLFLLPWVKPLSLAVLAGEFSLPFLLWKRPRQGFVLLLALHLGFTLFMPGLWAFTAAMAAAGVLFIGREISPS